MKRIAFLFLIGFLVVLTGCKEKEISPEQQLQKDIEKIKTYVATHSLDVKQTKTGLFYVINQQGTGDFPTKKSDVRVWYKGYTTDGDVFDQSEINGLTFNLQKVIRGWTEGIPKFKEGGKGKLLIPSGLAYGTEGAGSVPPNSVLIFDIELLEVVK